MTNYRPIRLALIGAGIFAREVHLPGLRGLGRTFEVVAVYSRTKAAAASLAQQLPGQVSEYDSLPELLTRKDIEAVDILLPIEMMPNAVELALRAGKHVLSEKPMAPDTATGRQLLEIYAQHSEQVWLVGENWRYEAAFERAAEIIHTGQIGRILLAHWVVYNPINPDNKYYQTVWRRSGTYPGGFLIDVGVHHAAVLRWLVGQVTEVSAITAQIRADLPPVDTLNATLRFENGATGIYQATYALSAPWPPLLHLTGEKGTLRVHRPEVQITYNGSSETIAVTPHRSIPAELAAFAAAIRRREPHRNPPQEAWRDLALIEAMLHSAQLGQPVAPEQLF
jgi:predicted dehydrogenase